VLIRETGERRTMRLDAEYGDACNLFDVPEEIERTATTALRCHGPGKLGIRRHKRRRRV
jgi:hypothetical protein